MTERILNQSIFSLEKEKVEPKETNLGEKIEENNNILMNINNLQKDIKEDTEAMIDKEVITNNIKINVNRNPNFFMNIAVSVIIIVGVSAGIACVYYSQNKNIEFLNTWIEKIIFKRSNNDFIYMFYDVVISSMSYISAAFILGFSPIFSPVIGIIPFLKGFSIGLITTYIYMHYKFSGFIYSTIVDMPLNIISIFAIILAVREAMKFSDNIYKTIKNKKYQPISIRRYIMKFIIILIIAIGASFLNALMNSTYFEYFSL